MFARLGSLLALTSLVVASPGWAQSGAGGPVDPQPNPFDCATLPGPEEDQLVYTGAFAPGVTEVFQQGNRAILRFTGDETIEYQIRLDDPDVQRGLLKIYEVSSDSFPVVAAGPGFRLATGQMGTPQWLSSFASPVGVTYTPDSVVFDLQDVVDGKLHRRRHTVRIVGKMLRIRFESLDTDNYDWADNYAGIFPGPTAATDNPSVVQLQGGLAMPLIRFEDQDEQWFLSTHFDFFHCNAGQFGLSNVAGAVPSATSIQWVQDTINGYRRNTENQLSATLDDTFNIIVTQKIEDALITSTAQDSPYRHLLERRVVAMLSGSQTAWSSYTTHANQWNEWGMDEMAVYVFNAWTGATGTGPDWYPAADPSGIRTYSNTLRERGIPFGAYVYFGPMHQDSIYYDADDVAVNQAGVPKTEFGHHSMAESAIAKHVEREMGFLREDYGVTMGFLDVSTYGPPDPNSGADHIDQRAGSGHSATLRDALLARKAWFRRIQDIVEGPLLGEGSHAAQNTNLEYMYHGYCDSVQRSVNSGNGLSAEDIPAGDPNAPTNRPVIPEYELRVFNLRQANHGNGFFQWFFGPSDGPEIWDEAADFVIQPYTTAAHDRYRAYELTYAHTGFLTTSGPFSPFGNSMTFSNMIKEYYLVGSIQRHYVGQPVRHILYAYQGQFRPFEEVLDLAGTQDAFVDAQLDIEFESGLRLFVNHATTDLFVDYDGVTYRIPEDGFLAYVEGTPFLAFSAANAATGDQRIDYCFAPERGHLFDGRGQVASYGGLTSSVSKLVVENFARGIVIEEELHGGITVTEGVAPTVLSVDVEPAQVNLQDGDRAAVRATARYSNGATRDVTSLVDWFSTNPLVAEVDDGAVLRTCQPGIAGISCSPFEGVSPALALVDVKPSLFLSSSDLEGGETAEARVIGAYPGELAILLFSFAGIGNGSCYDSIGGLCLDLVEPVGILGLLPVDASGEASWSFHVPDGLPQLPIYLQALVQRGPAGADSVKTAPLVRGLY